MDYEKKYKEAIKEAAASYKDEDRHLKATLERIFPELKEESEDERIRKELVFYLGDMPEDTELRNGVTNRDVLAWLEKQGEPFDKEKVLIGARKDVALSIINYLDNNSVGMCLSNMECEDIEDACINSKWTKLYNYMKKKLEKQGDKPFDYENANIQQKDFAPRVESKFKIGDIISNGRVVYRVDGFAKNCVGNDSYFLVNVEMEKNGTRYTPVYYSNGKVHNAGEIMWLCDQVDQMFQKVLEEKTEPAWSEEDKKYLRGAINATRNGYPETNNWLKSLKERVQPQQKHAWSEEDEIGLADAMWAIGQARSIAKDENDMGNLWYAEDWLKSLKERIGG